jgi:hypothetical protein
MYKWVDGDEKSCIFWLIGWPGTGKSAIARTVARHYHAEGRLAASFFFTRGGGDCSHAGLFATSIARQLADNKALGVQQLIRGSLKEHSQIAKQTLQDQWTQLVVQPLSRYERRGNARTFLIVIDALDECEEGDSIGILLRLLPQVGACKNIRVRILVPRLRASSHAHRSKRQRHPHIFETPFFKYCIAATSTKWLAGGTGP